MVHVCYGKFAVFHVDAQSLLGVVNRFSPRLKLNKLARELFWFCLRHRMVIMAEWVPREENSLADELSKLVILDVLMLRNSLGFPAARDRWGRYLEGLFASNANNHCVRFYSLQWCCGLAEINAFAFF